MNIFQQFHSRLLTTIQDLTQQSVLPEELDTTEIVTEPPKEKSHGDIATNAAMVLCKGCKKSSKQLADILVNPIRIWPEVEKVDIAGPGFINITLKTSFWYQMLPLILKLKEKFGESNLGQGETVNIEYVSVNPTGPLHIGHGRNAVLGDVLATLLEKVGYKVTKEYYVNDAGAQVKHLARSVYLRYKQAAGLSITQNDFTEDMYIADYLIPLGELLFKECKNRFIDAVEEEWLELFQKRSVDYLLQLIKEDLKGLGIVIDVYTSERALLEKGKIQEVVKYLEEKGDVYEGILNPPKGYVIEDWEPRPQKLFKATSYSDDVDRPLQKSDGTWTYFAGDIAYHYDKIQRGFQHLIDVLGADHSGYVKRIHAAVKALSKGQVDLEICVCQMINFIEGGIPVRMSKRSGTFIRLKDLVKKVGQDVTRFMLLTRHHDMSIDFDFSKAVEQSKDNPVFYIQYVHARVHSVLRHAKEVFKDFQEEEIERSDITLLRDEAELGMIKLLFLWPRQVEQAAMVREPHRLAYFLQEVAGSFHLLWNKGRGCAELRFVEIQNRPLTMARLALLKATALVIASGLKLFGIMPVEEMR